MDEVRARAAFELALASHRPEFGRFFLARLYGLAIRYQADRSIVEFDVHDFMFNPQGSLHGGVIAFVLDVAMGHLLQHAGGAGMTLEMRTQFLRPVGVGPARAEGRFLKRGRTISFLEARLWNAKEEFAAIASSTWQLIESSGGVNPLQP
jgi:acyl-CoA thioesterase